MLKLIKNTLYTGVCLIMVLSKTASADEVTLPPCPDKPNCVSSMAEDSKRFIEPLKISQMSPEKNYEAAWDKLLEYIQNDDSFEIDSAQYPRLTTTTTTQIFKFTDEVSFVFDPENNVIHMRSASRTGYYDFGKNRRRLENIRQSMYK